MSIGNILHISLMDGFIIHFIVIHIIKDLVASMCKENMLIFIHFNLLKKIQVGDVGGRIWAGKRDELEVAKKELIEGLKELENVLGDKPYFGGDTFGFVDISLIPFYSWFYTYEKLCNFKVEEECEKLIAWAKRCKQRDSVSKSVADEKEVYDFVVNYRKRFELD